MKHIYPPVVFFILSSNALIAADGAWEDREICRAATKTYFFLDALPSDGPDQGDRFGFKSAAGNIYRCTIEGMSAVFYWVNKSGDPIESKSTRFLIESDKLRVSTDMMVEEFIAQ